VKTAGGVATCVALFVALTYLFLSSVQLPMPLTPVSDPLTTVLWHQRLLDIVCQMLMVLAGTFGVLVLVKERMGD